MLEDDDDFGDVGQYFDQRDEMDANSVGAMEYDKFIPIKNNGAWLFVLCSDYPEAVVQNSDPQNDSVLLYDEVSGGLRALEERKFNFK